MKKIIRFVKVAPVLSLCIVAMVFYILLQVVISFTSEGRWKVDKDGITHFVLKDGTNASKQFIQYLGKTYYVDENGKKVVSTWIDD
ncbi:MAG: hypothetical protein MJ151_03335, partial [Lachnospiraceae bacterium]|nr:hypothetical protein [Lachnospiraceae bacterium]